MHVLLIHKFQIYGQTFKLNHQNWKNVKPIYCRSRKWTGCYNEKNPIVHSGSTVLKTWYEIPVPAFLCKPCNCIFAGSKILLRLPQFITFCGIPFSAFHAPDQYMLLHLGLGLHLADIIGVKKYPAHRKYLYGQMTLTQHLLFHFGNQNQQHLHFYFGYQNHFLGLPFVLSIQYLVSVFQDDDDDDDHNSND